MKFQFNNELLYTLIDEKTSLLKEKVQNLSQNNYQGFYDDEISTHRQELDAIKLAQYDRWVLKENEDGFIYPKLKTLKTGRIQTVNPNIQGLPKWLRPAVKSSGRYLVWADWSASQPNILARLSNDSQMLYDIQNSDIYDIFSSHYDRKTIKLLILMLINGAGHKSIAEKTCLNINIVTQIIKYVSQRWSTAFDFLRQKKIESESTGQIKINDEINIPIDKSYSVASYLIQYHEAQNMKDVASTQIDGADFWFAVHDEMVWSVDNVTHIEDIIININKKVSQYGPCTINYGCAWTVDDQRPSEPFKNPSPFSTERYFETKNMNQVSDSYLNMDLEINPDIKETWFVKAPKGMGKTYNISKFLDSLKSDTSILSISHLRSLSYEQAKRFNLKHYKIDGIDERLAIVINSINKVSTAPYVLLLDEITAILNSVKHIGGGGTIKSSNVAQTLMKLQYLIQNAHLVIALDADLDGDTIQLIENFRKDAESVYHLYKKDDDDNYVVIHNEKSTIYDHIFETLNQDQRLYITCSSKKEALILEDYIKNVWKLDKKGTVVHAESLDKIQIIQDFDGWIEKENPDYVITTPAVQSGVSIDTTDYFHHVVGIFMSGIMTVPTISQTLARVRNPIDKTQHIFLDKKSTNLVGTTNWKYLLRKLEKQNEKNQRLLSNNPTQYHFLEDGKVSYFETDENKHYNNFYCKRLCNQAKYGIDYIKEEFLIYLKVHNIPYEFYSKSVLKGDIQSFNQMRKACKTNVELTELKLIQDSPMLSDEEFKKLQNEPEVSLVLKPSFQKTYIEKAYGTIDIKTLTHFKNEGIRKIKMFHSFVDYIQKGEAHKIYDKYESANPIATKTNWSLKSNLMSAIFKDLGLVDSQNEFNLSQHIDFKQLTKSFLKHEKTLKLILPKSSLRSPIRAFNKILSELFGIRLKRTTQRLNGEKKNVYFIPQIEFDFLFSTLEFKNLVESASNIV